VDRYAYDLWGVPTLVSESVPQQLRYDGYWYDTETGWYWLQIRAYDPVLKRFLQPDPSGQDGQFSYAYAGDDPVDASDPTGLALWFCSSNGCENNGTPSAGYASTWYNFSGPAAGDLGAQQAAATAMNAADDASGVYGASGGAVETVASSNNQVVYTSGVAIQVHESDLIGPIGHTYVTATQGASVTVFDGTPAAGDLSCGGNVGGKLQALKNGVVNGNSGCGPLVGDYQPVDSHALQYGQGGHAYYSPSDPVAYTAYSGEDQTVDDPYFGEVDLVQTLKDKSDAISGSYDYDTWWHNCNAYSYSLVKRLVRAGFSGIELPDGDTDFSYLPLPSGGVFPYIPYGWGTYI